eukprot:662027-Pelagomonas_calceolata.AAC.7
MVQTNGALHQIKSHTLTFPFLGTAFWRALLSPLPASWDLSQDHNKPGKAMLSVRPKAKGDQD